MIKFISSLFSLLALTSILPLCTAEAPKSSPGVYGPLIDEALPNSGLFRDDKGIWYAFSGNSTVVQSTTTDIRGSWKSLPDFKITNPNGKWYHNDGGAPCVNQLADGSYIMFFNGAPNRTIDNGDSGVGNCIGVARASNLLGPYVADAEPYNCTDSGKGTGPSAPAMFQQGDKNYFVYKSGYGWDTGGVTKILVKEVAADGTTGVGEPVLVAEHTRGQYFEIEGPSMTYNDGIYYVFYQLGVWCDKSYHIVWSSSKDPLGEYTYGGVLLQSGTTQGFNLVAPGGSSFVKGDANNMTFMSYVDYPNPTCHGRNPNGTKVHKPQYIQLFAANLEYVNGKPQLVSS